MRPPRVGRRAKPALSRERIVNAAIELADADGIEAVSMRRIASKLGSGANSLYWYIDKKQDLLELMYDACIGEIELARPHGTWRSKLYRVAVQTRVMFQRHPWIGVIGNQPGIGPKTQKYAEFAGSTLRGRGVTVEALTAILAALNNYILGFTQRENAWQQTKRRSGLSDEEWGNAMNRYLEQAVTPHDAALARQVSARLDLTSDENFEFGLNCLLDGIDRYLSSQR
jgi:AcrR family transcriptional regulator